MTVQYAVFDQQKAYVCFEAGEQQVSAYDRQQMSVRYHVCLMRPYDVMQQACLKQQVYARPETSVRKGISGDLFSHQWQQACERRYSYAWKVLQDEICQSDGYLIFC